jgi:5-(carboxyamino)imidazole ribonucleotide synthase
VVEAFIRFTREISVIVARTVSDEIRCFEVFENEHARHILDVTTAPADLPVQIGESAVALATQIARRIGLAGVLCVEMFVTAEGRIIVNELAPRPHNSGHVTFDAAVTSQFEQQLRAVCGLPLGDPTLLRPAAMANLLGELWSRGQPAWELALTDPRIKLHLYGKRQAKPGRKMGHLTATGVTAAEARSAVIAARERLEPR